MPTKLVLPSLIVDKRNFVTQTDPDTLTPGTMERFHMVQTRHFIIGNRKKMINQHRELRSSIKQLRSGFRKYIG